ncbi:MAG: hypothetical protein E6H09_05475 [Bacteroidetes bacterium]|jgi:hypothetical protein|nr:MAG: hypothetical protein E6H09_05475 [Bacteroidota bacterium]
MKKIFTLIAATVLTVATFAADRRPSVTLRSSKNYEIVVDGRSYFSNSGFMDLSNLRRGVHSIKVYEMNRRGGSPLAGFGGLLFGRGKRLVDASSFQLQNRDININIDFRGQIMIQEERNSRDRWDNDRNSHDRDYQNHDSRDDRGGWDRH